MTAYYNEFDPNAARTLENLIKKGLIAHGHVDNRSILEVTPDDLAGYVQCHFFAGIGLWSAAARRAGFDDAYPMWSASCPCQPFSAAGKQLGKDDPRHLWPTFWRLADVCRPPLVFGEQVASKDGLSWLDDVLSDLERADYAAAAVDICAAGFGAPHIRQRLYWVALDQRREWDASEADGVPLASIELAGLGVSDLLADAALAGVLGIAGDLEREGVGELRAAQGRPERAVGGGDVKLADAVGAGVGRGDFGRSGAGGGEVAQRPDGAGVADQPGDGRDAVGLLVDAGRPGPVNGFWRHADWLYCRDGKWRPTQSGPERVADGDSAGLGGLLPDTGAPGAHPFINPLTVEKDPRRGMMLKAYGNAIVLPQATEFLRCVHGFLSE